MFTATDFEQERHELQEVLASGILHRAPNLALVLTYVCEKYFEGSAEQIKEYSIAVEALGRPAGFDQKRDSIVRVEAHRLRKRLREYYDADGAGHAVRIEIPPGQYAPRFLPQRPPEADLSETGLTARGGLPPDPLATGAAALTALAGLPSEAASSPLASDSDRMAVVPALTPAPPVEVLAAPFWPGRLRLVLGVSALLATCMAGALLWRGAAARAARLSAPVPAIPAVPLDAPEVRIVMGSQEGNYIDRFGKAWQSDRYFQGGTILESPHPISGTRDRHLFQSRREGFFSYDIPLARGVYELRLYFAETLYGDDNVAGGGETSRLFNIWINGHEAIHGLDVVEEVGSNAADVKVFKSVSPAADGKLHLHFEPLVNMAFVNAIEITPGVPGALRPIRMVSRDRVYTDKKGQVWEPDRDARGGLLVLRSDPVVNTDDPELFRGERFGNLKYVIPVPPGRYGVTLYFAEQWFGTGTAAGGGTGSRVFNILCNGIAVRRNFDIYQEAHGGGRAVTVVTHGVEPDAQGKLTVQLIPVRNYATISAVEVVDESN